jgi:hypothetical protein
MRVWIDWRTPQEGYIHRVVWAEGMVACDSIHRVRGQVVVVVGGAVVQQCKHRGG